jgi:hypothetical protein
LMFIAFIAPPTSPLRAIICSKKESLKAENI